jgi:hypothetical protein
MVVQFQFLLYEFHYTKYVYMITGTAWELGMVLGNILNINIFINCCVLYQGYSGPRYSMGLI